MFLPKHVEACFHSGSTTTSANQCAINHYPSAAFCAYHSLAASSHVVYANMAFPVYKSPTGFTCGSDGSLGVVETPNGNADADTEVSPTSHEIMEAITDPDTQTGWYDSSGYENGDECAYVYGATQGTARNPLQPGDRRPPLPDPRGIQQQRLRQYWRRVHTQRVTRPGGPPTSDRYDATVMAAPDTCPGPPRFPQPGETPIAFRHQRSAQADSQAMQ